MPPCLTPSGMAEAPSKMDWWESSATAERRRAIEPVELELFQALQLGGVVAWIEIECCAVPLVRILEEMLVVAGFVVLVKTREIDRQRYFRRRLNTLMDDASRRMKPRVRFNGVSDRMGEDLNLAGAVAKIGGSKHWELMQRCCS